MLTTHGRALLERWIYVLVRVGDEFVVPYSERCWERIARDPAYGDDFAPLLERCLSTLTGPGWRAGSYYPGGWYRLLTSQGDVPDQAAITPEALTRFYLDEVRVDRDGRWWVGDKPVTGRVLEYFLRHLHYEDELARYAIRHRLEQQVEMRYLHHESPPIRVHRVLTSGGTPMLWLNTGEHVPLRAESLRMDAAERLYCAVREAGLPAWFEEPARWALLKDADEQDGGWTLHLDGQALPASLDAPWPYADQLPA